MKREEKNFESLLEPINGVRKLGLSLRRRFQYDTPFTDPLHPEHPSHKPLQANHHTFLGYITE